VATLWSVAAAVPVWRNASINPGTPACPAAVTMFMMALVLVAKKRVEGRSGWTRKGRYLLEAGPRVESGFLQRRV
jgi:hypothetical protein